MMFWLEKYGDTVEAEEAVIESDEGAIMIELTLVVIGNDVETEGL